MSGKKVYDLAKEYGMQSKDFVGALQQAELPIKNHMSTITEQQEKYFKNNYKIVDNKAVKIDKNIGAGTSTIQANNKPNEVKSVNSENRNNNSPKRENSTQGGYQGQRRDNNGQGGYQGQRRDNNGQGGYQGQRRDNNGQGGYRSQSQGWDKDGDKDQRPYNQGNRNGQQRRSSSGEKPQEKSVKIDKNKKENKQKSEQKTKAKENFFNDEKPLRKLDNTKKIRGSKSDYKKEKLKAKEEKLTSGVEGPVTLPESITVSDLSEIILISTGEIIKILMSYGIMCNVNQTIDFETAAVVCEELEIVANLEEQEDIFVSLIDEHYKDESVLTKRPPIITVMGHVDHGKTSLLDYIRDSHVIKSEAGGITQHIGAYTIETKDELITFIDTPGHEAFTAMRSRGAAVTDIAVLVIAADDGIMPQTVEAINHAKAAKVPIIVAVNKVDKPTSDPQRVKQELTEHGLVSEEWGGDTICVNVSAKTGEGIDELLDMIILVAEVGDFKANYEKSAIGTIIEARIDKQRGVTCSLLVKSGTLHTGDIVVSDAIYGKVRAMTDHRSHKVITAGPSTAVEIIGLNEVPSAGDKFFVAENEKEAKKYTDRCKNYARKLAMRSSGPITLDDLFSKISQGEIKELNLIVKADVQGSFEAIKQSLEKLNSDDTNIKVKVIHGGVGAVTETDISLAYVSNALVMAFNVMVSNSVRATASIDNVEIRQYSVIYAMIEDIKDAMWGMMDPEYEEVVTAQAVIRQVFKVPNLGMIAGSYVTSGTVKRGNKVRVYRDGVVICDGEMGSLKRFQDDVKEVASGYEFGVGIDKFNDLKEEDTLEFYEMREIERKRK